MSYSTPLLNYATVQKSLGNAIVAMLYMGFAEMPTALFREGNDQIERGFFWGFVSPLSLTYIIFDMIEQAVWQWADMTIFRRASFVSTK